MEKTKVSKIYNADSIEVVKDIEHVRRRPSMYVFDTNTRGMQQLLKEAVDNGIDEYMAGHVTEISVVVNVDDNSISMTDNGRGIPVETHKVSGMSALSTVFMIAGAGGKFGAGVYKTSAGLHGMGITVVTALSEWLEVWSIQKGKAYHLRFEDGICKNKNNEPNIDKDPPNKEGVCVKFKPSAKFFKKTVFDPEVIKKYLKEVSYLCNELTVNLTIIKDEVPKVLRWQNKGGLSQMLQEYMEGEGIDPIHETITYSSEHIDLALVWTDSSQDEYWRVFCNSSNLPEGGTPVTGLRKLITNLVATKSPKPIDNDDIRIGLHVGLHVRAENPEFAGQSKLKLQNKEIEKQVYDELYPVLETFVQKNSKVVDSILKRALKLKSAREKFEQEKEASKNVTTFARTKRGILPGKLAEAPNCKPEERELFLLEGESASGTGKAARNAKYQEILPLKGKIPNSFNKTRSQILENEEVQSIITAIGAGIEDNCKPGKSRVGKVLLLMDADPDGAHITSLVLSLFVKYMRPLLDAGMIYVVDSPLFKAEIKGKDVFGMTREEVLSLLPKNSSPMLTRFKGHGECVDKSTLISTDKGLIKISDLTENKSFNTPSVTSKEAYVEKVIVTENRSLYELTTRYGYNISCTNEHKFLVFNKESSKLAWKKLKNLVPGDFVALDRTNIWPEIPPKLSWEGLKSKKVEMVCPTGICIYCGEEITGDLYHHLYNTHGKIRKDYDKEKSMLQTIDRPDTYKEFETPKVMNKELARLLGYLIGDGSFGVRSIQIANGLYEESATDAKFCIDSCFPGVNSVKYSYTTLKGKTAWGVRLSSIYILGFLYDACGLYPTPDSGISHVNKTYHKIIPKVIMESPKDIVVEFLRGYFECDGSCTGNKIEVYSASNELISQLRVLLLKFGIITKGFFEQKKNPFTNKDTSFGCQLYMEGEAAKIFQDQIGFASKIKNSKYIYGKECNTNIDVVPGLKDSILSLRDTYRIGKNSHTYVKDGKTLSLDLGFTSITKEITYQYLYKNPHLVKNLGKLSEDMESIVLWVMDRKPLWDEIISIIPILGKETVYDLRVPDGSSYVADGFITHNSNPLDLKHYAMDPMSRKLLKVAVSNKTDTVVLQTMGQDSNFRKILLGL